jgi:hypothetical protein
LIDFFAVQRILFNVVWFINFHSHCLHFGIQCRKYCEDNVSEFFPSFLPGVLIYQVLKSSLQTTRFFKPFINHFLKFILNNI